MLPADHRLTLCVPFFISSLLILLPLPLQVGRPNVASMMSQQGFIPDVWAAAAKYLKERKNK
jgi:hypothetical protein